MTEEELAWAALEREADQYTRLEEQIDLDEGRSSPKMGDHHHQMDAILMGLLQDLPQGLDTTDESGNATIHIAAQHGNLELVNFLLREGAAMPMSALDHAVNSYREGVEGGVEMLRLLVGTSPHEHLAVLRTLLAESQAAEVECVVCLCEGGQQHADLETCLRIVA